ncbi:MAG: hypothetical protein RI894_923, partial [Bacteroidota bacterium]
MNFLFWNINKKQDTISFLRDICIEKDVDVLLLAESPLDLISMESQLNLFVQNYNNVASLVCQKIQIFTKSSIKASVIEEQSRHIAVSIEYNKKIITLIALHFQSQMNWSEADQGMHVPKLKTFIDLVEKKETHQNTLVVGDFNMNPFDKAMVGSMGLNAVMEKRTASDKKRTVDGDEYHFFYNPMWAFLGDLGKGIVSGTHYYNSSAPINYYW